MHVAKNLLSSFCQMDPCHPLVFFVLLFSNISKLFQFLNCYIHRWRRNMNMICKLSL